MYSPESVDLFLRKLGLHQEETEHVVVLALDVKNRLRAYYTVSIGNINCATVVPGEVFKPTVMYRAASIVMAQNHPSGDVTPSPQDMKLHKVIKDAGEVRGIRLLDNIVVAERGYHSLKNKNPESKILRAPSLSRCPA